MDDFNVNRNDVNIMCKGTEKIFTQVDNLFPSFRIDRMNNFPYYKELYTTPINNLKVCLHFSYIDYFIVNDQGVCIGQVYDNYKDAVKAADEWDLNYKIWLEIGRAHV